MSGIELPIKAMRQQIASAVNVVIQANRLQGGKRRVTYITEVVGMEQDTLVMQDIFRYHQEGIDENGKARGRFEATGIRPKSHGQTGNVGDPELPAKPLSANALCCSTRKPYWPQKTSEVGETSEVSS